MGHIKDGHDLKALQSRLEKVYAEHRENIRLLGEAQQRASQSNKKVKEMKRMIKESTPTEIVMSEHSILRYLSRVELIPIEEVEAKVVTEELKRIVGILGGNGEYPILDGKFKAIMKNFIIITIE